MAPATPGPQLPPPLTGSTPVLISHIPLPPSPSISYAKYVTLVDHQQQYKAVELARQRIVNRVRQSSKSVLDSLLPIVCISKEEVALWLFAIGSEGDKHGQPGLDKGKGKAPLDATQELEAFAFDGLQSTHGLCIIMRSTNKSLQGLISRGSPPPHCIHALLSVQSHKHLAHHVPGQVPIQAEHRRFFPRPYFPERL